MISLLSLTLLSQPSFAEEEKSKLQSATTNYGVCLGYGANCNIVNIKAEIQYRFMSIGISPLPVHFNLYSHIYPIGHQWKYTPFVGGGIGSSLFVLLNNAIATGGLDIRMDSGESPGILRIEAGTGVFSTFRVHSGFESHNGYGVSVSLLVSERPNWKRKKPAGGELVQKHQAHSRPESALSTKPSQHHQ